MDIRKLVKIQQMFFSGNQTKSLQFRMTALSRLEAGIKKNEAEILGALKQDLHKSEAESYMAKVGMTLSELRYVKRRLPFWIRGRRVSTPLVHFPAKSFVIPEPYGVALIMSPWNYPFMLCMEPLIGAIAAGNCCVLKPSAYAPTVSRVIHKIISEVFPRKYVAVVEGGRKENTELLDQKFDYIFFTGGVEVGKTVMEKAAKNLTPVTLELGGKSPCIVDATADLDLAARRIVFGKFLNSGQTCVAPDYLLVEETVKDDLVTYLKKWIRKMLGNEPVMHPDYPKIINRKHFNRLMELMKDETVLEGGYASQDTMQIAPTILDHITWDSPVMQQEIFGPILPILTFCNIPEAISRVKAGDKPLALYLFTKDPAMEHRVLKELSFGGGCINDTIIHLATSQMGFGGVGASGMGSYHGKASFETFSHRKSVLQKSNWLDLPMRYYPLTKWKETLIRLFLR